MLNKKYTKLIDYIKSLEKVVVAFSGGVDSTFLLKASYNALSNNVIALTAKSSTYPEKEFNEAVEFGKKLGVKHIIIQSEELNIKEFAQNTIDRCYFCKNELFSLAKKIAKENNIKYVLDGSNYDDLKDYRPGMKAAKELNVVSPLVYAQLTKKEIRKLSKKMKLPTWNKPAFACLASRFPYGQTITREKLKMVERAEEFLFDLGFKQVRVRHFDKLAKIEVLSPYIKRIITKKIREKIINRFKKIGFLWITIDLEGYNSGNLNRSHSK